MKGVIKNMDFNDLAELIFPDAKMFHIMKKSIQKET